MVDHAPPPKHAYGRYLIVALLLVAGARLLVWSLTTLDPLVSILLALNIATFALMGWDKAISPTDYCRVPELILWGLALLGGSGGLLLGMKIFRHKTSKSKFQFIVVLILAIQAVFFTRVWGKI